MKRQKEYSVRWRVWVLFSGIALIANVAYAIWGYDNNKSNILTLISGWISGIATAFIGVITFTQNKRYKKDSDDSLEKQYQFESSKLILSSRSEYVQEIRGQFRRFFTEYDCRILLHKINEIEQLNNPLIKHFNQINLELEVDYYIKTVATKCNQLESCLDEDRIATKEKEAILKAIQEYSKACENYLGSSYRIVKEYVLPIYDKLVEVSFDYFSFLKADMNYSLARIRDYSYIVNRYSLPKEETDDEVENMISK